jgi:hypothetical protein
MIIYMIISPQKIVKNTLAKYKKQVRVENLIKLGDGRSQSYSVVVSTSVV